MEKKLIKLVKFIVSNASLGSVFLTPEPDWTVNANDLLHEIIKIWTISQSEMSEIVDKIQKEIKERV